MEFLINDKPEKDFLPMEKIMRYLNKLPNGKMVDGKALKSALNLTRSEWIWFIDNPKCKGYIYKQSAGIKILCGNVQTIKAYIDYRKKS